MGHLEWGSGFSAEQMADGLWQPVYWLITPIGITLKKIKVSAAHATEDEARAAARIAARAEARRKSGYAD